MSEKEKEKLKMIYLITETNIRLREKKGVLKSGQKTDLRSMDS